MVGETGFEPATPWTQTKCATKLRYSPTDSLKTLPNTSTDKLKLSFIYFFEIIKPDMMNSYLGSNSCKYGAEGETRTLTP